MSILLNKCNAMFLSEKEGQNYFLDYKNKGYFIFKNLISKELLETAYDEILNCNSSTKYFDRLNRLRRIEEIYNKGKCLKQINEINVEFLKLIFKKDLNIFKDKYNDKPPGGEGFFAHYDGIFLWEDENSNIRKGWHDYAKEFFNCLIPIDTFTVHNGPLEISKVHKGSFEELLENTKKDGTPNILEDIEKNLDFEKILISPGDVVVFSSMCPHRSSINNSSFGRRSLYFTYNKSEEGDFYNLYFEEKRNSKNKQSKSLTGELKSNN